LTSEADELDYYSKPRPARYGHQRRSGAAGPRSVDWTSDQHLGAGWVKARVPAYFQIRKNEDHRERLSVRHGTDGSLTVVNGLGADIRQLYVADGSGLIFEGRDIPTGAERRLEAVPGFGRVRALGRGHPAGLTRLRANFTTTNWCHDFQNLTGDLRSAVADVLSPNCYLASLRASPFVESPLSGASCQHTAAIVYGISKGDDDGR
jgi:hypothetical protein